MTRIALGTETWRLPEISCFFQCLGVARRYAHDFLRSSVSLLPSLLMMSFINQPAPTFVTSTTMSRLSLPRLVRALHSSVTDTLAVSPLTSDLPTRNESGYS